MHACVGTPPEQQEPNSTHAVPVGQVALLVHGVKAAQLMTGGTVAHTTLPSALRAQTHAVPLVPQTVAAPPPGQVVVVGGQMLVEKQVPSWQIWVSPQTLPMVPQLASSVLALRHTPFRQRPPTTAVQGVPADFGLHFPFEQRFLPFFF